MPKDYDTRFTAIIIKEIELKCAANGHDYCNFCVSKYCFKTKKKIGKSRGIKSWDAVARLVAKEFKNGDKIEIIGNFKNGTNNFSDYIELVGYNHLDAEGKPLPSK